MERKLVLVLLVVVLLLAGSASAGISGTKHDMSTTGPSYTSYGRSGETQVCVYCHTPHGGGTLVPLWNHQTTATASFTLYSSSVSSTLNATTNQPTGASKACLSCHDGTVGVDYYGGTSGSKLITGAANVGTDLSNDHPVSFTYNSALATTDGGLVTPSGGKVGTLNLPLFGASADQLECATCHSVHNATNGSFLRASNTGSALCSNCHNK